MENVKSYFEQYPNSEKVLQTSDGFCFSEKNECDAKNHASTLKDKNIVTHGRPKEVTGKEVVEAIADLAATIFKSKVLEPVVPVAKKLVDKPAKAAKAVVKKPVKAEPEKGKAVKGADSKKPDATTSTEKVADTIKTDAATGTEKVDQTKVKPVEGDTTNNEN